MHLKHANDEKRRAKALKKLTKIVDGTLLDVASVNMGSIRTFESIKKFNKFISEQASTNSDIKRSYEDLQDSIKASLDGNLQSSPLVI